MRIRTFQGLAPREDMVEQVVSVPYDVVNTREAAALAEGNPYSLLHIVRPEIDFPEGTDPYSDPVYANAREVFRRMQENRVLVRESGPCLYLYRQVMGAHSQTGLVAVCHIEDYENDVIKKHEKTRPEKENDRTRLTGELSANPGPVFLTYPDHPEVDARVASIQEIDAPPVDFTAPDGVRHTVWRVVDDAFVEWFSGIPAAYVADGHHRSASAARVGAERRAANPDHSGEEEYNWFLSVLFPASQLQILGYHRVVRDLKGRSAEQFLEEVGNACTVTEAATPDPAGARQVGMYLDGKWWTLSWEQEETGDPVDSLDVSVLQERVLAPLLGIDDPRTSPGIDFVGGIRGTAELEARVDGGEAAVAFALRPVGVDQLMAIADAGEIMPPKSTWFEPKLRSGLFIHTF